MIEQQFSLLCNKAVNEGFTNIIQHRGYALYAKKEWEDLGYSDKRVRTSVLQIEITKNGNLKKSQPVFNQEDFVGLMEFLLQGEVQGQERTLGSAGQEDP